MTKPLTILETMSHDAHALHKKIGASMARSGAETWADVKVIQADTLALADRMKAMAADEADAFSVDIQATIKVMEAAGAMVQTKTGDAAKDLERINEVLLDSVERAVHSLRLAVDELRTRLAVAIAPATAANDAIAKPHA